MIESAWREEMARAESIHNTNILPQLAAFVFMLLSVMTRSCAPYRHDVMFRKEHWTPNW
jgi:hypothetical protein